MELRESKGPERIIQDNLTKWFLIRGWHVMETHGSMFQKGFPDLFICHKNYGHRWVEVKYIKQYEFTPAQMENFPKLCSNGSGVWILTAANDTEYRKLWHPPNWEQYLMLLKRNCR